MMEPLNNTKSKGKLRKELKSRELLKSPKQSKNLNDTIYLAY